MVTTNEAELINEIANKEQELESLKAALYAARVPDIDNLGIKVGDCFLEQDEGKRSSVRVSRVVEISRNQDLIWLFCDEACIETCLDASIAAGLNQATTFSRLRLGAKGISRPSFVIGSRKELDKVLALRSTEERFNEVVASVRAVQQITQQQQL